MYRRSSRCVGAVRAALVATGTLLLSACATGQAMFMAGSDGGPSESQFAAEDSSESGMGSDEAFQTGFLATSGNVLLPFPSRLSRPALGGAVAGLTGQTPLGAVSVGVEGSPLQAGVTAGLTTPLGRLGAAVQAGAALSVAPGGGVSTTSIAGAPTVTAGMTTPAPAAGSPLRALTSAGALGRVAALTPAPAGAAGNPNAVVGTRSATGAVMSMQPPAGGQAGSPTIGVQSAQKLPTVVGLPRPPGS